MVFIFSMRVSCNFDLLYVTVGYICELKFVDIL